MAGDEIDRVRAKSALAVVKEHPGMVLFLASPAIIAVAAVWWLAGAAWAGAAGCGAWAWETGPAPAGCAFLSLILRPSSTNSISSRPWRSMSAISSFNWGTFVSFPFAAMRIQSENPRQLQNPATSRRLGAGPSNPSVCAGNGL